MHEKNIRWGEVVGGLLIVSSSIALVVSFWEHIAARPLLKFGIFTGVTASLFGLGLHASHRWKLPTTSQGMLMIAMMLVPLNFLAMASFAEASELTTATIVGEFATLGVFLLLGHYASRILTPKFPGLTDVLVVGLAFYNLLIRRFVFADPTWEMLYAVALPMVVAYLGCLWPIGARRQSCRRMIDDAVEVFTNQVWKLLGLASFAFALAAGFLIVRTERVWSRRSTTVSAAHAGRRSVDAHGSSGCGKRPRIAICARCWCPPAASGWQGSVSCWPGSACLGRIPWPMIATCSLGALICLGAGHLVATARGSHRRGGAAFGGLCLDRVGARPRPCAG